LVRDVFNFPTVNFGFEAFCIIVLCLGSVRPQFWE